MTTTSTKETNGFVLRQPRPEDLQRLGEICYEAFKTISEAHGFPADFPSVEVAVGLMTMMNSFPMVYGVVAEDAEGRSSAAISFEMDAVVGVGPDHRRPLVQNSSIGKTMMTDVIRRGEEKGAPSIRLVQAAYHNRSLSSQLCSVFLVIHNCARDRKGWSSW